MYIHFPGDVYERLSVLAQRDEISIAAFVAKEMARISKERVTIEYTVKEESSADMRELRNQILRSLEIGKIGAPTSN
ncbi:hypothetical protein KASHIRA_01240 [Serratia phage vB_SmaM-Kashira]|nr:hypothetical protein [Acinetobacter phage ABPH49]URC22698.1 hypothetical protein KASHIRA_01240 [Serratia phage vB_SmaM-Kashira]